jgi:hypothetical protein
MNGDATFGIESHPTETFLQRTIGAARGLGARGAMDERHDGIRKWRRRVVRFAAR